MDHRNTFAGDSLPGGTFRGPPVQLCGRFLARWYIPWTTGTALREIPCPVVHSVDHRDRRTQSCTHVWIKTRIFSPATEPECPSGIVSGIFDPVWASGYPFGIVFGIFDPVWVSDHPSGIVFGIFDPVWASDYPFGIVFGIFDPVEMVESPSRGWLGAGPKKSGGGPAPQIAIVRLTVARDPRPKTDPRQGAETGAILSVTGSILIGTCSIKQPRQDRNSAWDPVAGWKVAERRKNSLRQDRGGTQNHVADGKRTKETIFRQRQDRNSTQNPVAGRPGR